MMLLFLSPQWVPIWTMILVLFWPVSEAKNRLILACEGEEKEQTGKCFYLASTVALGDDKEIVT